MPRRAMIFRLRSVICGRNDLVLTLLEAAHGRKVDREGSEAVLRGAVDGLYVISSNCLLACEDSRCNRIFIVRRPGCRAAVASPPLGLDGATGDRR